ncbi:DNRLRE domain-containing protein [Sorangium sp. So ce119]|uniref:DNRLRE domain-containing protein n=1 Tax=Sorangium sp. So ce119 TaxID=3133279 RepID=UPI003F62D82E
MLSRRHRRASLQALEIFEPPSKYRRRYLLANGVLLSAIAFGAGCSPGSPDEELHGTAKLAAGTEDATCVTIQRGTAGAVEDATIWEVFPTWNDSTVLLRTGTLAEFGVRHAVLRFDLSPVPAGANVASATLRLEQIFRDTTSSSTINIHRILSPWTESTVTWQSLGNGSDFDPAIAASFQSLPGVGIRSADLTSLTAAWLAGAVPNHGVLLEEAPVLATSFPSSEEPQVGRRPSLEVCYTTATTCTGTLDDGDACTTDTCDPVLGILHTPISTDDGDPSTIDTCDPATGAVTHVSCPALDPTVATRLIDAVGCIYQGPNAPQTGMSSGAIDVVTVAVVKGKVATRAGVPLSGVQVSVLHHGVGDAASYGQVLTRADGAFELVVRGGQPLTVKYEKSGYLPVQRDVRSQWQQWSKAPDVVMIESDPVVTPVALGSTTEVQVARGSVQSDESGARQATLLFPPGTTGTMTVPDPSGPPGATMTVALPAEVHVRATEYTVGPNGPEAMPGTLPPTSGYTYAVELGLDEAVAAGAIRVEFDRPIPFYVENFLDFPVGMAVPLGYYDARKAAWIPAEDGRIIEILGVSGGVASVDIDGDGAADDASALAALGLSAAEQQELATLYAAGTTLWRVQVTHFTPWDANWPFGPPRDPTPEPPPDPGGGDSKTPLDEPCKQSGSIIECENQILGERLPVSGTPFSLHYQSDRTTGRKEHYRLEIPVTKATVHPLLKRIELQINVAGRIFSPSITCPCQPDQKYTFEWDGRDAFGRLLVGKQPVVVELQHAYDGVYTMPAANVTTSSGGGSSGGGGSGGPRMSFSVPSDVSIVGSVTRMEIAMARRWEGLIGSSSTNGSAALGGMSLDVHHAFDPVGSILTLGDGTRRDVRNIGSVFERVAGEIPRSATPAAAADGLSSGTAYIGRPSGLALGPDGTIYYSDQVSSRVRKISPDGVVTTVAGVNGVSGYNGDNRPATEARLVTPGALAIARDGRLYISDAGRVRRVALDGTITTVAGNGSYALTTEQNVPATSVGVGGGAIQDIALAQDGSLYIAVASLVRKVDLQGIITTVAGTGERGYSGDGGPAVQAKFTDLKSIALGSDGSFYVADAPTTLNVACPGCWNRIRRIDANGIVTTIAGGNEYGPTTDAVLATEARIGIPGDLALGPDGSIYYISKDPLVQIDSNPVVRRIAPTGFIYTVVGNPAYRAYPCNVKHCNVGVPVAAAELLWPSALVATPLGFLLADFNSDDSGLIARVGGALPGLSTSNVAVASKDGSELYVFDETGRHFSTLDALLGVTRFQFGYDAGGRLTTITDVDNQMTQILRDASGAPTAIVAPTGQTTSLSLDAEGFLWTVTNPANETTTLEYYPNSGLLRSLRDPGNRLHEFQYDADGRLTRDTDPASGYKALSRTGTDKDYQVTITTAEERTQVHAVEEISDGSERRTFTGSDGLSTVMQIATNGVRTITAPDGTVTSSEVTGDPRFGMQAPILRSETTTTPLGRTRQVTGARSVSLSIPGNSLSISSLTDTVTINGRPFTQLFNKSTNTVVSTLPSGRSVTTTLTPQGRVGSVAVTGISPIDFAYFPDGRLHTVSQGSKTWTYAYEDGWLASATDPLLRTVQFIRDAAGRATQATRADEEIVEASYYAGGLVHTVTPPGQPAHTFNYTPADLLDEYVAPDAGSIPATTSWSYDLDHLPTGSARPGEPGTVYTREPATGRLSQVTMPLGMGDINLAYHPTTGNLSGVTGPSAISLDFGYDGALMTSRTWSGAGFGTGSRVVSWTYDNDFRVDSETVNGGAVTSFGYDVDGFLSQAGGMTLSRHPQNGLYTGSSAGVVSDTVTPDAAGGMQSYVAQAAGSALYHVSYTLDALGRIDQRTETILGETHSYDYDYDLAGRLTDVFRDGVLAAHYDYDANGNRLARTSPGGTEGGTYDDQDRLLTYGTKTYGMSPAGDRTSVTDASTGGTATFTYDAGGNLRHAELPGGTSIDYLVDGEGHRIWKERNGVRVQGFLYRSDLQSAAELDGAVNVVARFVYGRGRNLPDLMIKGGATYRILTDHLGSPRLVVDIATGTVAQRMDFDEFGRVLLDTNPGFTPFGFAGGLYDRDTGLVRFGVRDYDPETGRWTAKDPLGFGGGDTNVYGYCGSDPVNYIDTDGRHPLVVAAIAAAFILHMGAVTPSDTADAPADILSMGLGIAVTGRLAALSIRAAAAACGSAAAGAAPSAAPLLTPGPGWKMLGEALNILKGVPAAQRAELARDFLGQIEARAVGGAWRATEMAAAGGGRAWVGETHTLIIDAAGRVFTGAHVEGAVQFGVVEGQLGVAAWSGLRQLF